jgi:hypothetical protein
MRTTSATNGSPTSYTRSCKAWLTVKINYVIIHCYYCYCLLQIIKRIIVKTNSYNTVRYVLDHNPALFRFHLKFLYQRPKCTWQNYISFCATTTPGLMQHLCGTGDLHSFFVALTWLFSCHFNVCHFFFFVVLGIEVRVLYMLGRDHWATFLALPNRFLASLLLNLLTTKKRERNLSFNCPSYIIYSHMPYNISS